MMDHKKYLIIGVTILVLAVTVSSRSESVNSLHSIREVNLKKILNFESFKKLFDKHYGSILENLARKRLFLGRALSAFVSAVGYKHRKSTSYLALNHMSDWTPGELKQTIMSPDVLPHDAFGADTTTEDEFEALEVSPVADIELIQRELAEIKEEPGIEVIVEELKREDQKAATSGAPFRRKRDVEGTDDVRPVRVSELVRKFEANAVVTPSEGFSKPKMPADSSQTSTEHSNEKISVDLPQVEPEPLPEEKADEIVKESGEVFVTSIFKKAAIMFSAFRQGRNKATAAAPQSNMMYIDHRTSKCYLPVKEQGMCGSCWAMAAVSAIEWSYCERTGEPLTFSEQYLIDCGQKVGLRGCTGGNVELVSDFVRKFGLELEEDLPYKAREVQCPYKDTVNPDSMGFIRAAKDESFVRIPSVDFETQLKKGPILVLMLLNPDIHHYGGGVAPGEVCLKDWPHSALLVGYGREDGEEFWLFRFAYTSYFGESGHYKLNKKTKCLLKYGYVLKNKFSKATKENYNPRYDPQPIKEAKHLLDKLNFNAKKYSWDG